MNDDARIYLDHNATSPLRPEALDAMQLAMGQAQANPSSMHAEGRAARAVLEQAREAVADLAGAKPPEVVFTSGGSEGIAAAIKAFDGTALRAKRYLLFQKHGAAGPDGQAGTGDDITP